MVFSLFLIGAVTLTSSYLLSRSMTDAILQRDAVVSSEFFNGIVRSFGAVSYFYGDTYDPNAPELEQFFKYVSHMPNVLQANVFAEDRSVLWSSDVQLIGRKFDENDELEAAFLGILSPEVEILERGEKEEHVDISSSVAKFVENYLPIWDLDGNNVVGVVEVYRDPQTLLVAVQKATRLIWIVSLLAALLLFLGLTWTVRRANKILESQHSRLVATEKLAVIGETAAAVAHGIRNPLASIRSSAELAADPVNPPDTNRMLEQIVGQTDRLEAWIRDFLDRGLGDGSHRATEDVALVPLLSDCLDGFRAQFDSAAIQPILATADSDLAVRADLAALRQAINTVIANSIEAMSGGGELRVACEQMPGSDVVGIEFADTGPGFRDTIVASPFNLFRTTKRNGLGVGLNLARGIVERFGGRLELSNRKPRGALVRMIFPA